MSFVELFLIGVGLSMDAFAVSICKGLSMKRLSVAHACIIGLFFGGFQALMPLIGWFAGSQFASIVQPVDHWVAFVLLAFVGGKMLFDAFRNNENEGDKNAEQGSKLNVKELLMLAIATSIDALAVGISFGFMQVAIAPAITIIGLTTFMISIIGVFIGHFFGARFEKPATIAGGVVLILIGLRILLEHLGVI